MHTLTAQRTQHLDALCADCHARTAVSPRRSSQPGVQSVQAPAVLRNHSSMEQLCHLCRALAVLAAVCPTSVCSPGAPSSSASCIAHPALDESRAERFKFLYGVSLSRPVTVCSCLHPCKISYSLLASVHTVCLHTVCLHPCTHFMILILTRCNEWCSLAALEASSCNLLS